MLLPDFGGGGAERVALQLVTDWVAKGYAVDLLLMRREGPLLALLPPQVRVVDLKADRIRAVLRPLVRYLRERRPAAIQISMWPLTVIGILARRLSGAPTRVVVSEHVSLSRQYAKLTGFRRLALRKSLAWFYPRADARIAVSAGAADDLAQLSGIERTGIDVVYSPVAQPPPDTVPRTEIESLWCAGARVLTVGRLSEEKNHALLIRAFARMSREREASLVILGEGDLRQRLEALVREEGVEGKVALPGFALDPWPCYAAADLFVLSSNFEGFGLVLVEAMRSGLDVVSTDCPGGPREILSGGAVGRLVPCGDAGALAAAMAAALTDPADPAILRRRGEELSGADASDRYLELMLGAPAPGSLEPSTE